MGLGQFWGDWGGCGGGFRVNFGYLSWQGGWVGFFFGGGDGLGDLGPFVGCPPPPKTPPQEWEERRRQNIERMNEEMEKIAEYERNQRVSTRHIATYRELMPLIERFLSGHTAT